MSKKISSRLWAALEDLVVGGPGSGPSLLRRMTCDAPPGGYFRLPHESEDLLFLYILRTEYPELWETIEEIESLCVKK
eukprot:CAMPEP_0185746264 /NCGR_PEP_ID=MMETSP1174-20130828/4768_1 /TAXON_ID=35687 /ORGANISM="Dictyocha speculum, Strain CCMP1381" /LENGTH=77 /DNA_ID=CAMNT_0028420811 /DNA_START=44 /DNA_END=277 /DNA_ORIENTATION=-